MGYLAIVYVKSKDEVEQIDTGRVVGLYHYPPAKGMDLCPGFCDHSAKKLNGWRRHSRVGFMTHSCGRRHKEWRKRFVGALFDYLGINLLPRSETPKQFQNPNTWGAE